MQSSNYPATASRYINMLLDALEHHGVRREDIIRHSGFTEDMLADDNFLVPLSGLEKLWAQVLRFSSRSAKELGMAFGAHTNYNAHGPLGIAGMSSENLGQSLQNMVKYWPIVTSVYTASYEETDTHMEIRLIQVAPLSEQLKTIFVYSYLGSFNAMKQLVIRDEFMNLFDGSQFEIPLKKANNERDLIGDRPVNRNVKFNTSDLVMRLPIECRDIPFPYPNKHARTQALKECDQILERNQNSNHLIPIVKQLIRKHETSNVDHIASLLFMSARTLQRKLAQHDTSFRELTVTSKMDKAADLIVNSNLSITQISYKVGYQDSANFSRSFKKQFDQTPKQYRSSKVQAKLE